MLFTAGCYLDSFLALVLQEPSLVFRPHTLLRGNPPTAEISTPEGVSLPAASHGSRASTSSALPTTLLWWSGFFCLSMVIRLFTSYCWVGYEGWFLSHLVVIPEWSWEEVSVASTELLCLLGSLLVSSFAVPRVWTHGLQPMYNSCPFLLWVTKVVI